MVTERIVTSFWMTFAGLSPPAGRGYVERARALTQRAEALGGTFIAFGGQLAAFAFDSESLEEAISLCVAAVSEEAGPGELAWACGVSQGKLEPFASGDARAGLSWGPALTTGAALARVAGAGSVLVDRSVNAKNDLVTLGRCLAKDNGRRVRGAVLDVKQPWKHVAAGQVARLSTPALVGREDPSTLLWMPGALAILRADPGLGGTRLLLELANLVAPGPCLLVLPGGSGLEPLGALRRALARAFAIEASNLEPELQPALRRLLAGDGVPFDIAAAIVASHLRPTEEGASPGALLIDDAAEVDASSIEVCARAVLAADRAFPCVVRLDATSAPPPALAVLPKGPEMDLKPLNGLDAEALASSLFAGALDAAACKRWARRGSMTPLGIVEAIAASLTSGELAFRDGVISARTRTAGRGRPRPAREWIARRAHLMSSAVEQLIVALVTLAGGEVRLERVERVLAVANVKVNARQEAHALVERRWLVEPQPGWLALPTRSHREAIMAELTDEALRCLIHRTIAHVLQNEEHGLGLADAAHHLARAGEGAASARVALACARTAGALELRHGAMQLIAFAREQDPSCESEARAQVASAIPTRPSARPAAMQGPPSSVALADLRPLPIIEEGQDSEPPTMAGMSSPEGFPDAEPSSATIAVAAPIEGEISSSERSMSVGTGPSGLANSGASAPPKTKRDSSMPVDEATTSRNVGERLTELAKEALLGADTRALERWTEGLLASGEHGRFADRMQAILRLSRGDVGEALRVLRNARAELDAAASPAERCQTSLALGVALAVAGRPDEALLEALDALARARESGDDKGAHACLAFLAKLYVSVDRNEDAGRLGRFARIAEGTPTPAAAP